MDFDAPFTTPPSDWLLGLAMRQWYAFLLIFVRMSGVVVIGPVIGTQAVPRNARVLLAFSLAVVAAPAVASPAGLTVPDDFVSLAVSVAGELILGLAAGLGMTVILSGLQLAGELIDQQSGVSLGAVVNPGFEELSGSISGRFLFLWGSVLFVMLGPFGGHLRVVGGLLETFRTLPPGSATLDPAAVDLLRDLVQVSCVLALRVAGPVLAAMALVALVTGFLGHSVPQVNVLTLGFPIRAMVATFVLALSLTGGAEAVTDTLADSLDRITDLFRASSGDVTAVRNLFPVTSSLFA
ncbi:MAG: flagellar biosynthetic protein FliR [Planctomycetota bacterium]